MRTQEVRLFASLELRDVLERVRRDVLKRVERASDDIFRGQTENDLVTRLAAEAALPHLVLDEARVYRTNVAFELAAQIVHNRRWLGLHVPPDGRAIRAEYHVPFTGDPILLRSRPNSYYSGGNPLATLHEKEKEFVIGVVCFGAPDENPDGEFEKRLAEVRQYVLWVTADVTAFNVALPGQIRQAVSARLAGIAMQERIVSKSKYPIHKSGDGNEHVEKSAPSNPIAARDRPTMRAQAETTARVFVSYCHADSGFVDWLVPKLKASGVASWVDKMELLIGDSLLKRVADAIDGVDFLVAILSRDSVESSWVQHELEIAMTQEISSRRVFVLPIVIDDCVIPKYLTSKLYGNMRPASRDNGLDQLVRAIKEHPRKRR